MRYQPNRTWFSICLAVCLGLGWDAGSANAADRLTLEDDPGDPRVYEVSTKLEVGGKIFPQPGAKSALPLKVSAGFRLRERRTEGTGRQAQSLRSVRHYDQAGASITAGNQVSNVSLRDEARLILAEGTDSGVELSSPALPLKIEELELLRTAGDSLFVSALLPREAVETGDSWKPAAWVLPAWTGIEAVEKSSLSCTLAKLDSRQALVRFQGEVIGAVFGAAAKVTVEGEVEFDLSHRHWRRLTLRQAEKRAVGTVSPGLDVEAKVESTRGIAKSEQRLSAADLSGVSLVSNDATKLVAFEAPLWNLRFHHSRQWHLLNQNSDSATLRFVEKGDLLAQCTLKRLPDAEPGEHVSEQVFRTDIQKTLDKNFEKLIQAERIPTASNLYTYRVVAQGTIKSTNEKDEEVLQPMLWHYYLIADSRGRQLAVVFTFTPEHAERFGNRDLELVGNLEFFPAKQPTEVRPTEVRGVGQPRSRKSP
jgi:hypothetical protein